MIVDLTTHAIQRFQERYAKCSKREAKEMLRAAYLESRTPPKYVRRKYPGIKHLHLSGRVAFYHKWSGLLLICGTGIHNPHAILTVVLVPFPDSQTA